MLSPLLDAEQLKSRSTVRHEFHSLHKTGPNCVPLAAGDLRRQRQKEFVYSFRRQELSEECRPAFVKEPPYPKLRIEQSQHRHRSHCSAFRIQSMNLNKGQFRCACLHEYIAPGGGCDHYCAHSVRSENCSLQLQSATAANNDKEGVFGFMQHVYPVFSEQKFRIGVGVFRNPKTLGARVVDGTSADDNCISRSSQQSHDETIRGVRTTYGRAASLAFNLVAHDPVKSGNEIRNDKGPLSGRFREMQIAIVHLTQTWRECRFRVTLGAINEGSYERHLLPLGCS